MKKAKYILFLVGALLLVMLFWMFGIKKPVMDIVALGWGFALIVLIYLPNHILMTYGWRVLITAPVKASHFYKLVCARIAGDATTLVGTLAAVAGEPLKAMYIKDIVPFQIGLASVVLDRTIHMAGSVILLLTGIILGFFILKVPVYVLVLTFVLFTSAFVLLIVIIKKQRDGFLDYIISCMPRKLREKILAGSRAEKIKQLDNEISFVFSSRDNMHHFYISLFLHTVPTLICGTLEVFLIMYYTGHRIGLLNSMFVYLFGLFITTVMFFMPANIGTAEGSYSLALGFLGFDPVSGISIGLIRRLRTAVWALFGMSLLFYAGLMKKE